MADSDSRGWVCVRSAGSLGVMGRLLHRKAGNRCLQERSRERCPPSRSSCRCLVDLVRGVKSPTAWQVGCLLAPGMKIRPGCKESSSGACLGFGMCPDSNSPEEIWRVIGKRLCLSRIEGSRPSESDQCAWSMHRLIHSLKATTHSGKIVWRSAVGVDGS